LTINIFNYVLLKNRKFDILKVFIETNLMTSHMLIFIFIFY
jgi:hypothetical protein